MCWMCDRDSMTLAGDYWGSRLTAATHLRRAAPGSSETALMADGVGDDIQDIPLVNGSDGTIFLDDAVPGDTTSTQALTVDGPAVVGTLETIGDQDYYRVELVAGESYDIGMYAKYGGPNGVPLLDSFFEIRNASGELLDTGDGDGETTHNLFFTGFDALKTFVAPASGLYFINARAYDDGVTLESTGNYVGDYELFIRSDDFIITPPPSPPSPSIFLTTTDTAGNDLSTTATIAANGPAIVSTIDSPRDQDFYKIEMVAGRVYRINQSTELGGPSGVPLGDAYFELYNPDGHLITSATAGGPMPGGLVTTTVNAQLDFYATTSGTYYINARYANLTDLDGNTAGDGVGDYKLGVESWKPYYNPDSPLYSIDWGTQIDGSSRNPDGQEGPRPTGNAFTGHAWNPEGIVGKNVVYFYFAKQGEIFISEDPANAGLETMVASGFRDWEKNAYNLALDQFEKVADIVYVETQNRNEADFIFITYDGTPDVGILGRMSPPDTQNEGQTEFNRNGPGWDEEHLVPGGFSFGTLIHELGHGHGLAHPHDNGGRSGEMRGVESDGGVATYTTGAYGLNQAVYTLMSYNFGWPEAPHGNAPESSGYGYLGGLAAFDIAAIQDKYGVNEEWATGNDTYVLKDVDAIGTYYQAIWDAGGTDQIVYAGARNAVIDLRPATLQYEYGGGGWVSYALGIHGGYTIANAVTIENATSGSGNDTVTGNAANNLLNLQHGGNDTVVAGDGRDVLYYGAALTSADRNDGGDEGGDPRGDLLILQGNYNIALGAETLVDIEKLRVLRGDNTTFGDTAGNTYSYNITMSDGNVAPGAELVVQAGSLRAGETLTFNGSAESDGSFQIFGGRDDDVISGGAGGDHLLGRAGDDSLAGNGGADRIRGGLGKDLLAGGAGADIFVYAAQGGDEGYSNAVLESTSVNYDTIDGFAWGEDLIDLPTAVAALASDTTGPLSEATFDSDLAAALGTFTAGSAVLFTPDSGDLAGRHFLVVDANGDGGYQADSDFVIELLNPSSPLPPVDPTGVFV